MPRSRQCRTSSLASDLADAVILPAFQATFTPATSSRCSLGRTLNQSCGPLPNDAVAATASRRLDEPVAEGVEDAGEVAADFGDCLLRDLREGAVECLMDFRLQSGAAF